ncbi:MAG: hypothetical protein KDA68_13870 [Planctomycetaceae bacterium]|nr:hypothetical protein [Planctomycetaceae bacterium]
MTWYAQQIFAQPRRDVIAAFQAIPALANAIYHVPDFADMQTTAEVTCGGIVTEEGFEQITRTIITGPRLPPDGLLIIRELCNPIDDDCGEWFGPDRVSWAGIGENLPLPDDPLLQMESVFSDAPQWWSDAAPPIPLLVQLRHIADTTNSIVAYYACHMWGGDVECVFGWIWDGERKSSNFYRGVVSPNEQNIEDTGFSTDLTGAYSIDRYGRRFIAQGNVLTLLLLHFGLLLSNGDFELHHCKFPWNKYKLPPPEPV